MGLEFLQSIKQYYTISQYVMIKYIDTLIYEADTGLKQPYKNSI